MRSKVEAENTADTVTFRQRTGFLVYFNSAPIYWNSKKQSIVKSIYFVSELIETNKCCE